MFRYLPRTLVFWLALLIPLSGMAQQKENKIVNFDSAFNYIAVTLASQDIHEAISQSEHLLSSSVDSFQKMKSLMLKATLNMRIGEHPLAIQYAFRAEKIAEEIKNDEWKIRISGFLSTSFRELGLLTEGEKYLAKAEKANTGAHRSPLVQMFIHQEKAYYQIYAQNYTGALNEIRQAITILNNAPQKSGQEFFLATSLQIQGYCELELGHLDQAEDYLLQALKLMEHQESTLTGFIYQNLGELALKRGNIKPAIQKLDTALNYARSSDNFNLKSETYLNLRDCYMQLGNKEKALEYQLEYSRLVETKNAITTRVSNSMIEQFDSERAANKKWYLFLYIICGCLLLAVIVSFFYSRQLRKKERAKYLAYMERFNLKYNDLLQEPPAGLISGAIHLKDEQSDGAMPELSNEAEPEEYESDGVSAEKDAPVADHEKQGSIISKETEERVLKELRKFETKNIYLKSDITLAYMAARLKTNTKYLSAILKAHRGKDFSTYINELRIEYIINKLHSDTIYRDYKIAYLAEEAGFSGHSKFATTFKAVTGISPSAFISNLKSSHKE